MAVSGRGVRTEKTITIKTYGGNIHSGSVGGADWGAAVREVAGDLQV